MIKFFPVTVVDNFLDNPQEVLYKSKRLNFTKEPEGRWPGERTSSLSKVEPRLHYLITRKILSLFFPIHENLNMGWSAETYFQKISKTSAPPDSPLSKGWVHIDTDAIAGGVLYLNEKTCSKSGTGIYEDTTGFFTENQDKAYYDHVSNIKQLYYRGEEEEKFSYLEKEKEKFDNLFKPDLIIPSKYNRLVLFDSTYPHRQEMLGTSSDEDRLVLVFFLTELQGVEAPLYRLPRGI